jgi:O-antigen/teichoic acid export membrane protein
MHIHRKGLKRRVAAGALWVSVETWGSQVVQFGIFIVLSRLLGPEAYGLIGLAILVNLFGEVLIVGGGWGDAIVQRRELTRAHEVSLFWLLFGLSLAVAALAAVLAGPAATLFRAPELAAIMPWLALQLPISALGVVPRALLRRDMRFAPLVLRGLTALLAAGATAIGLAYMGAGVWSLVVFQLAQPAVGVAIIWAAVRWRPSAMFSVEAVRDLLPFVGGALGDRAMHVGDAVMQRTVIGLALGPVALGFYTFAHKILELLIQLVTRPIARVLLPTATRLAEDASGMRGLVAGAAELAGLVVFPLTAGLAVVASDAVPLVFGDAWRPAIPIVQALMVVAAIAPFNHLAASVIYASGRTRWQFGLTTGAAALLGALFLVFGAADLSALVAALVVRSVVMLPVRLLVARRTSGINLPRLCAGALRPLAAAALMAAMVLLVQGLTPAELPTPVRLALSVVAGAAFYGAAIALFARGPLRHAIRLVAALRA